MTAILPPARTAFTNSDGTPTRPFYNYLQQYLAPDTSALVRDIATISDRLGAGDGTPSTIPAPLFNYVGLGGIFVQQDGNTITIANNSPTDEGVIEEPGTTRTARLTDLNKTVHATSDDGLTITIPLAAAAGWQIGNVLYALQGGATAVQYVGATGVTFEPSDSEQSRAQGSLIAAKMIEQDVWEAVGDLAYFAPSTTLTGNPTNASAQPINIPLTADGHVLIRRSGALVSAKVTAAEVVVTPTGNISSTDAQSALAELDTEKVDKAQLASAAGAGLVGNTPAGNIAATTVQGALNELDAEKATIPGAETFAVGAGTAQAITATFTPAITTLVDGMQLKVRAFLANTAAAPTLAVNALTAQPITKQGGVALVAGDIHGLGHELLLRYVAATPAFELLNPAVASGGGGGGGTVDSVQPGSHISVDNTDPANPIVSVSGLAGSGYSEGTSFPASPSLDDKFYRTDVNLLCYFDGTRWLTATEYALGMGSSDAVNPIGATNTPARWPVRGTMYLTSLVVATFVAGASNNGSNYWALSLDRYSAANSGSNVASFNTASDGPSTWVDHEVSINAVLDASARELQMTATSAGGPSPLYSASTLYYRRVIT